MRRRPFQMSPFRRRALHAIFLSTVVTGLAWGVCIHFFRQDPEVALPVESLLLKAHLLGAMLTLVAVGSALPLHAQKSWQARVNRTWGGIFLATFGVTALSGWGLLAFFQETRIVHFVHLVSGALMVAALVAHIVAGRRASGR